MSNNKGDLLLKIENIFIDGFSDERWHKIIKGIDLIIYVIRTQLIKNLIRRI